jgi:hypothetical protein
VAAERAATVAEVEGFARVLAASDPAEPGDPPWHLRLAAETRALCPAPHRCASAELVVHLVQESR